MNDFTKEELNYIADGLALVMGKCAMKDNIKDNLVQLLGKLESMIDNYCEHKFYVNGCGENVFAQCHKCGEIKRVMRK